MSKAEDILSNAGRLISDAAHLHAEGRSRSAATLIVVALEQLGAFVETLTRETYPNAVLHVGIFGDRANAHAKRQDALAAHVLNFALAEQTVLLLAQKYQGATGEANPKGILKWIEDTAPTIAAAEHQLMHNSPDVRVADTLMRDVRTNRLQHLREYGLYEDVNLTFSDADVGDMIELAARVRVILSRSPVIPETVQIRGINMPEGLTFPIPPGHKHQT